MLNLESNEELLNCIIYASLDVFECGHSRVLLVELGFEVEVTHVLKGHTLLVVHHSEVSFVLGE